METKEELIKNSWLDYEPKKKHQWLVIFPKSFNIESWVVKSTSRPSVNKIGDWKFKWDQTIIKFHDPVGLLSTSRRLFDIISATNLEDNELTEILKSGFDYDLELLDPTGEVIEKWTLKGCRITEIKFGELDYTNSDNVECTMVIQPTTVKLIC